MKLQGVYGIIISLYNIVKRRIVIHKAPQQVIVLHSKLFSKKDPASWSLLVLFYLWSWVGFLWEFLRGLMRELVDWTGIITSIVFGSLLLLLLQVLGHKYNNKLIILNSWLRRYLSNNSYGQINWCVYLYCRTVSSFIDGYCYLWFNVIQRTTRKGK